MYVVDKLNLKIIQVADNYYECPVCHKWLSVENFSNNHRNCLTCYNMPIDEMILLKKKNEALITNHTFSIGELTEKIEFIKESYTKDQLHSRFEKILSKLNDKDIYGCQASVGSGYDPVDYSLNDLLDTIEDKIEDYSSSIGK